MFAKDPVTKRISASTLKMWQKQEANENAVGRESRGRKPCPAFETALLSELLCVTSVHASDKWCSPPPFPPFSWEKTRGTLICFAIINGGR
jgi:hypothetical protein